MKAEIVDKDWFCTDCGRGPVLSPAADMHYVESHAPSCQGRHDPDAPQGPRKYGRLS